MVLVDVKEDFIIAVVNRDLIYNKNDGIEGWQSSAKYSLELCIGIGDFSSKCNSGITNHIVGNKYK